MIGDAIAGQWLSIPPKYHPVRQYVRFLSGSSSGKFDLVPILIASKVTLSENQLAYPYEAVPTKPGVFNPT